jgi:type II secretory pathway pseudopilin PulG
VSLIEILIAVVLMGTVVTATLTGLHATIAASALDRDHANAHAWLQTAADMLYARELVPCGSMDPLDPLNDIALIANEYQGTIRQTDNPEGWSSPNISVIGLEWWSIDIDSNGVGTEAWGTTCDAGDTNLQKVELQVTGEDGRIVEEVEVIIGG